MPNYGSDELWDAYQATMNDPGRSQDSPVTGQEPEPVPMEPTATTVVIVVGSFDWGSPATVVDVLSTWWEDHGRPAVQLVTSGCPHGAEPIAREFGIRNGWMPIQVRDEELVTLNTAIAFLFIRDHSHGAEKALGWIEMAKIWHKIFREETVRQISPWADR